MPHALQSLLADVDAIAREVAGPLSTRPSSLFRLRGPDATARAVALLLGTLLADLGGGGPRRAGAALRDAARALGNDALSARDLRLLQEGLRGVVLARVEAADPSFRAARPAEDWFHELAHQVALYLLAQREELIERQAAEIEMKLAEQRQLSIPIVQVYEGVLIVPLVGALDVHRAQLLVSKALEAITNTRARLMLLDVSGIPRLDGEVVGHVLRTVRAARLLGSQVILVGVSPEGASEAVRLDAESGGLVAMRSLEEGLAYGMAQRATPLRRRR